MIQDGLGETISGGADELVIGDRKMNSRAYCGLSTSPGRIGRKALGAFRRRNATAC